MQRGIENANSRHDNSVTKISKNSRFSLILVEDPLETHTKAKLKWGFMLAHPDALLIP